MKTSHLPEESFLESNPTISPADMTSCIFTRTNAIIDTPHIVFNSAAEEMPSDTVSALLWQVSGNLDQLERITKQSFPI